jgi:hypothetical protein
MSLVNEFNEVVENKWVVENIRLPDADIWVNGVHFYVHDPVIVKYFTDKESFYEGVAPWWIDAEYSNLEIYIDEENDIAVAVPVCFLHSMPTQNNTGVTPLSQTWDTLIVREITYLEDKEATK